MSTPEEVIRNRRLWGDTGTNNEVLPVTPATEDDIGIDDVFTEAAERYPDDSAKQTAYARVIVIRRLLAPSAMQGRYVQNQSEEDLEKIFDNLEILLRKWEKEVTAVSDAVDDDTFVGGVFFGLAPGRRGR